MPVAGLGGCAASDPNCDTVSTFIINSYEPDANNGVSFALNGKQIYLATNDKNSSFAFKSKATRRRSGRTSRRRSPAECGSTSASPTCFYRALSVIADVRRRRRRRRTTTDPSSSTVGSRGLPSGVNQNNLSAIHTYDDGTVARSSAT